jgi:hypothetical protein
MTAVPTRPGAVKNPPDWIVDQLKQVPGLAVGLLVAWYATRQLTRLYEAAAAHTRTEHAGHLATKDAVIARLDADIDRLRRERDKWQREALGRGKP